MNRRFNYQFGGKPKEEKEKKGPQYYKDRDERIRNKITGTLDEITYGFGDAMTENVDKYVAPALDRGDKYWEEGNYPGAITNYAIGTGMTIPSLFPPLLPGLGVATLSGIIQNMKSNPNWKEDMKKNAEKFQRNNPNISNFKRAGGVMKYKKGGVKKDLKLQQQKKINEYEKRGFLESPTPTLFED